MDCNAGFPVQGALPCFGEAPSRGLGFSQPFVPPTTFQVQDTLALSKRGGYNCPDCKKGSGMEEAGSFFQGLASPIVTPIKMMTSSVQNFIIGGSLLGAGAYVLMRYGKVISPLLVVGGMALGGYQGIKGLKKLQEADTPEERKQAFYDLGNATANFGLGALSLDKLQRLLPGKWLSALGPMHEPLHLLQAGTVVGSQAGEKPH
jgi:hypothetical protein